MTEMIDGLADVTSQVGLFDLVAGLLLLGAVLGGLRRRSVLAAVGSLGSTALVLWLGGAAALVWGPELLREVVSQSALLQLVPLPTLALEQAGRLVAELVAQLPTRA